MSPLVAGLDLGTSSAKLVVLDLDGRVVAEASSPYPTRTAAGGVVEQDPEHWWRAACETLQASGVAGEIRALGLTGQMQDLVLVRNRRALRPAILYSDTRAAAQHSALTHCLPHWEEATGNHQDVSNVAAKIAWLSEHEPATLADADTFLLSPAGYVAHRAGARAGCDVLTASTTGILDLDSRGWSSAVLDAVGIRADLLPTLSGSVPGDEVVGQVDATAAPETGLAPGTPLVLAMGDAGATTAGLVGDRAGDAYLYLGTTGWLAAVTSAGDDRPSPIHSLVMPRWDHRLRIGAVQSAGSAASWALDTFLPGIGFAAAEERVRPRLERIAERPLCLPGLAGERTPVRDGSFRGSFVGLHDSTQPEDLYLAVLTGVAMGLRHAADHMGISQHTYPLVGGAAGSGVWRQVLADVFGATIVTGAADAPGAYHAAAAAADGIGRGHGIRPVFEGAPQTATEPSVVHGHLTEILAVHRELYDALTPTFHRLADLRAGTNEGPNR